MEFDASLTSVVAGVFAGNMLFFWFMRGLRAADKENLSDIPWSAFRDILVPLGLFLLFLWASFGPPPHLGS